MKRTLARHSLMLALLAATGCSTVLKGTRETVRIASDPPGAAVEVGGVPRGTTPVDVELKKGFTGQTVILKKQGYQDMSFQPSVRFDPVSILNVFAIVGFGVDALTGAMMQYDQATYTVPLAKNPKP